MHGSEAGVVQNSFLDMLSLGCLLDIIVKKVIRCMTLGLGEKTELEL